MAAVTLLFSLRLSNFIEQSLNMRLMSFSTTNKYFTFTDCSKVLFCKARSGEVDKMWKKEKDKNMKLNTITRLRRNLMRRFSISNIFDCFCGTVKWKKFNSMDHDSMTKVRTSLMLRRHSFQHFFNYRSNMFSHRRHHYFVEGFLEKIGCRTMK